MFILAASIAPAIILVLYFYFRDRYEKEPKWLLLKAIVLGGMIIVPAAIIESLITPGKGYLNAYPGYIAAGYSAFIVAGLVEEGMKYIVMMIYFYRNREFDEIYDGIIYAVFIALGFATVENILYVLQNGLGTALIRAFTAVPAHALFGATMGYYLGFAKFGPANRRNLNITLAIIVPIILHGIYDFILLSQDPLILVFFIPYIIFLWIRVLRQMKRITG